jgi:hypothetical protein
MGKFDSDIALWRQRRELLMADIEAMRSEGISEQDGQNESAWNNVTEIKLKQAQTDVALFDGLLEVYDDLNA